MKETGARCKLVFVSKSNLQHNILRNIKKSSQVRQSRKTLTSVFTYFEGQCKTFISAVKAGQQAVYMQFKDYPNVSLFSKILTLKSFGKSKGKSYRKFLRMESLQKFQNIMNRIVRHQRFQ